MGMRANYYGLGKKGYQTLDQLRDISSLTKQTMKNPKYKNYTSDRIGDLDQDIQDRFRGEAYRQAGAPSAWMGMMQGQMGQQQAQNLSNLQQRVGTQTQSAWERMATGGLQGGQQQRLGHKAQLAGAFGAQSVMGDTNQRLADLATQDEQDRLSMLSAAPGFETSATAGSRSQAALDLENEAAKREYESGFKDVQQQARAAAQMARSYLDPKQIKKLQQNRIIQEEGLYY